MVNLKRGRSAQSDFFVLPLAQALSARQQSKHYVLSFAYYRKQACILLYIAMCAYANGVLHEKWMCLGMQTQRHTHITLYNLVTIFDTSICPLTMCSHVDF